MRNGHRQAACLIRRTIGVALMILACGPACAVDDAPVLRQRFVPVNHPEVWPTEEGRDWVPIRRTELDRILKQAHNRKGLQQTIPFDTAHYSATFDPVTMSLSLGNAEFKVSAGQASGDLIRCVPLNLSMSKPRWADSGQPALLGAAATGDHFLLVPAADRTLQFDWQLSGVQRLSGVEFLVRIPPAVASVLSLETPPGWTLTASTGTVTQGQDGAKQTSWRLDLGRRTEARLRFIEPGQSTTGQQSELTTASLTSRLELTPLVVESTTEISFASMASGITSLEVQAAAAWQIRSVERASGGAVPWQDLGLAGSSRRLQIEVPEGVIAVNRGFVINASRPIPQAGDLSLELPRLVDAVLLDGNLQVSLGAPFTLQDYSTTGLRQTDVSAETSGGGRTLLSFQQFSPNAQISLSLRDDASNQAQRLSVREFVVGRFDLNPPEFHADLQLESRSRDVFSLDTWIPNGWEVTRVTHRTSSGLQVEVPWQTVRAIVGGPNLVRIGLPDGLDTGRPAMLQISAQHITWTPDSVPALPAVFPEVGAITSLTTSLLFRSKRDASAISIDGFELVDRELALAQSVWSPVAADLAGQPITAHVLDSLEDSEELASLAVRRQRSGSPDAETSATSSDDADIRNSSTAATRNERNPAGSNEVSNLIGTDSSVMDESLRPVVASRLESFVAPGRGGRDLHRMSWKFAYGTPEQTLSLSVPQNAVLLETFWNEQPLAASADESRWTIRIPKVSSGDTLTVSYTLKSKDVYLRDTRRVEMPSFEAISASFEWTLHMSTGYAVVSLSDDVTRLDSGRQAGWLRWFFGPLARATSADWFNPLVARNWIDVLRPVPDPDAAADAAKFDTVPGQPNNQWSTVRAVSGGTPRTLAIDVCRVDRLHALAWFVLIATCLIGVSLRTFQAGSRNRIGLIWLSGCLVASVVVPDRYAELIGAAILGTVVATLLPRSLIRPRRNVRDDHSYPSMSSTIALPRAKVSELLRGLLLAGVLLGAGRSVAQNRETGVPDEIEILVPYQGDRLDRSAASPEIVYTDSETLRQLQRSMGTTSPPPDLLITAADLNAIVDRNNHSRVQSRLTIAVAESAGTVIEVPVPASLVDPETPVLLDGQSISALPGFDGRSLLIPNPAVRPDSKSRGDSRKSNNKLRAEQQQTEVTTDASPLPSADRSRPTAPALPELATEKQSESGNDGQSEDATNRGPSPAESGSLTSDDRAWTLHTLDLHLRPETQVNDNQRQFQLPMPRVAQTHFRLKFEVPPAAIRDSRTGMPVGSIENGTVFLQPGSVREVALHWASDSARTDLASVTADVRSAAEVHPGRVLRQTLVRYVPTGDSRISRIAWKLPRRVQLDRQQVRAARLVDVAIHPQSDHTRLVLEFDPPHSEPFTLQMDWQQIFADAGATDSIQWEVPITSPDAPLALTVESHLAGVKAAPGFTLDRELADSLEQAQVTGEAFLEMWPADSRPRSPQIAVRLPQQDPPQIAALIEPVQTQRSVRQNLEARILPTEVRWTLSAEIETSNAPTFLHEFSIPNTLQIDSVFLQQDEVDRLSHWERSGDRLVLFLRDRLTGIQAVTIEGRQPFDRQQPIPVPQISVTGAELLANTLQVYSQAGLRPVLRGAELTDVSSELNAQTTTSTTGYVGEYRLASNSNVSIELLAVVDEPSLRWLGIVDLIDDQRLQVELAIAVSTREITEWQIALPDWVAIYSTILSIDGMEGVSSSESLSAVLNERTLNVSVPVAGSGTSEIRLRLPVEPAALEVNDGQPQKLTPPECNVPQTIPATIVARQGSSRLGITGELISGQQQKLFASLLTGTFNESGVLKWDTSCEVTVEPDTASVLPAMALHTVSCGGRIPQICRTRVLVNAGVTQIRVRWPESIQEVYRRVNGRLQPTWVPTNRHAATDTSSVEVIELSEASSVNDGSVRHLEFLWKPQDSPRPTCLSAD